MARIGATIGLAFALAIAAGPVVEGAIGVPSIFWPLAPLDSTVFSVIWVSASSSLAPCEVSV
jgi:hypothetical protein